MKEQNRTELQETSCRDFVVRMYRFGKLDTRAAYHRLVAEGRLPKCRTVFSPYYIGGMAAAVCLLLVGIGLCFQHLFFQPQKAVTLAAGDKPEAYTLPDGSQVTLAPHAVLSFLDGRLEREGERQVDLQGKAYFEVVHRTSSPFVIHCLFAEVQVVGTQFEVRSTQDSTQVWVESGQVRFATAESEEGVLLKKGMQAVWRRGEVRPLVACQREGNRLAWKKGYFEYDNTPLDVVLQELSSYYHVRLSVENTEKRLTGRFSTRSLVEIIGLIEGSLEVHIVKEDSE